MIEVHVDYFFKNNEDRDAFYKKLNDEGIAQASREEAGNIKYEYYYPIGKDAQIFLLEQWKDAEAVKEHGSAAHYLRLQEIKADYVSNVELTKYSDVNI